MIEGKKSSTIKYLSYDHIETIYKLFFDHFQEMGESIPDWSLVNKRNIQHLVEIPQNNFFGIDHYDTIEKKASAIFYHINKGHIFPNGNKRLSIACTVIFLIINGIELSVDVDAMTRKALEIANSDPSDFEQVKQDLTEWIKVNQV
jgi:death on curing protein